MFVFFKQLLIKNKSMFGMVNIFFVYSVDKYIYYFL